MIELPKVTRRWHVFREFISIVQNNNLDNKRNSPTATEWRAIVALVIWIDNHIAELEAAAGGKK